MYPSGYICRVSVLQVDLSRWGVSSCVPVCNWQRSSIAAALKQH